MARLVATNFTGGLQFPYATAAADLFHKEDVQTLALAVDGHDHTAGKGLPVVLTAGSIPGSAIQDGTITSAKIADGTIVGADIADGAITGTKILDGSIGSADLNASAKLRQVGLKYLSAATFSSTTTGSYVMTPVLVSATLTGAKSVQVHFNVPLQHNTATAVILVGLAIDGGSVAQIGTWSVPVANSSLAHAGSYIYEAAAIPGGVHTFTIAMFSTAGTMSLNSGAAAHLWVTEWND
jgi:hypothetical protein